MLFRGSNHPLPQDWGAEDSLLEQGAGLLGNFWFNPIAAVNLPRLVFVSRFVLRMPPFSSLAGLAFYGEQGFPF